MTAALTYVPLLELALFNILLAFSQYIVLRAGVFSLATAALTALGSYCSAILTVRYGLSPVLGILAGVMLGALSGVLVALPLARLRGVFQALATLALVQITVSIALNWTSMTEGALGINGIPKVVHVTELLVAVLAVGYFLWMIGSSSLGRAFDIIREDETVAVSLGIQVRKHHTIAFVLSGTIAGLAGALHSYSSYSITAHEFGFHMVVIVLAMVVLGGRVSVLGPVVGAIIMTALPELLRGFEEYRSILQGVVLMLSIIFLPLGVVDTTLNRLRAARLSRATAAPDNAGDAA